MKSEQKSVSKIYSFLVVLELNPQKSRLLAHLCSCCLQIALGGLYDVILLIRTDHVYILPIDFNVVTKTAN